MLIQWQEYKEREESLSEKIEEPLEPTKEIDHIDDNETSTDTMEEAQTKDELEETPPLISTNDDGDLLVSLI